MTGSGLALLFPGQGSQFVGMGRDLAERFPLARETFAEADDALNFSLSRLCWEGPEAELVHTRNAQPAILVHSIAVWRLVGGRLPEVEIAAGHSLGEFSAYVAAGALQFADGVRLVRRRGDLMFEAGTRRPGAMAAVLGLDDSLVEQVCTEASSGDGVVVAANFNAPGQVVISGDARAVERAGAAARAAGARRVLPLSVSGAFHSPLMREAEEGLADQLRSTRFVNPRFPVVSNVTAEPVVESEQAARLLLEQLTAPVRWTDSVRTIASQGARRLFELGPGAVLAGLVKRIERESQAMAIGTAEQVDAFLSAEEGQWS